jgi:two-component system, cell cycle response regulator
MTPLKKVLQSSNKAQPTTIYELFQNVLAKNNARSGWLSCNNEKQPEVFFVLKEDIPAEALNKLLHWKKGAIINLKDDLLPRLLKLEKENHHLKSLSTTDELTGVHNKRFFNKQLKIEIARTKRTGQPFCLMFIDLDNFKSINDTLGHHKGDEFLVKLCQLINQKIRPTDYACRFGGDEFTIIMPSTSILDGIFIAQRWHDLIEQIALQMKLNVSSSIGIDEFDPSSELTADEFLDKVDKEMYNAKSTGKNKISYPGLLRIHPADTRSVTPAEKDALYQAFAPLTQKNITIKRGKN